MRNVEREIAALKEVAKKNGLEVKFRNHKTNQGDFCIFIYDRNFRAKSYTVGYDGDWGGAYNSFEKCLQCAYHWIENRDKRFKKVNGKWIVNEREN